MDIIHLDIQFVVSGCILGLDFIDVVYSCVCAVEIMLYAIYICITHRLIMVCSRCKNPDHNMASWDCPLRKSYVPKNRRPADYIDHESIKYLNALKNRSMEEEAELQIEGNSIVFTADENDLRLEFELSDLLKELSMEKKLDLIRKMEAIFEDEQEELLDDACKK